MVNMCYVLERELELNDYRWNWKWKNRTERNLILIGIEKKIEMKLKNNWIESHLFWIKQWIGIEKIN